MEIHLRIVGIALIVLALLHAVFPRYFNWRMELASLSLINRQVMYVHTFFIALVLILVGSLCLTSATELVGTALGNRIALGLFIFWFARLLIQFFGYSSELWRGKKLETAIHIVFSLMWTYFSIVFLAIYWYGRDIQ